MHKSTLISLCFLSSACFDPETSHITFLCDETHPSCPSGSACNFSTGICLTNELDADLAADLAAATDIAIPSGCAPGIQGFHLGNAFACPGVFAAGKAAQLCASDRTICSDSVGIDFTRCGMVGGFFIANVPSYWRNVQFDNVCAVSTMNRQWAGCGAATQGVYDPLSRCKSFPKILDCSTSGWNCSAGHTIAQTANGNPSDGVLCCPP